MKWTRLIWGLAGLLAVGDGATAATLRVPDAYPAIASAIGSAVAGDTVLVAPGVYTNCDDGPCTARVADIFEGLTLLSEGGPDVTLLELVEGGPSSGLRVVGGDGIGTGGARVEGFEMRTTVANARGMAFVNCWNVSVVDCRVVDVETSSNAAAGLAQNGGSLEVIGCEFVRCTAALEAGAMKANGTGDSRTVVRDSIFEECGPTAMLARGGGDILVTGCVFRNNFGIQAGGLAVVGVDPAVVTNNRFIENTAELGAGLVISANSEPAVVDGNLFLRNRATTGGGGLMILDPGEYSGNTFVGNEAPIGTAVLDRVLGGGVLATRNIFALGSGGTAYHATREVRAGDCNVFWANSGDAHSSYTPGPNDLFVDPQFCDVPNDDYTLRSTSPCAEENAPSCGRIGAYGVGCGTVSVEDSSWANIKSRFRTKE